MSYIQQMSEILRSLLNRFSSPSFDPRVDSMVERAIELVDPRLKSFSNYPKAYRSTVAAALAYAGQLVEHLPTSFDLSPSEFTRHPLLHALFSDVEAIHCAVRESREIKQYCEQNGKPEGGELFALMGVRRHNKKVFGPELVGDEVQQDVEQTLVYFDAHTLILPSVTQAQLTERLESHLFDSLIKTFREQIRQGVMQRMELETERDILASRLHSRTRDGGETEVKLDAVRQKLTGLNSEYELSNYARLFNRFMTEPEKYLRLEQSVIPIDLRGVMRKSDDRLAGEFQFQDLISRDRRRWTLYPVRLKVDELQGDMHCSTSKERWMEI